MAYKHAEGKEGAELIPGAADAQPEVSADGKTYKFTLRKGMKYSDGTPAKASDFEHTIQRSLSLEWGGLSFFEVIQGVDKYVKDKKEGADISGITSNNATGEITIKLTEANGQFPYILAFPSAGLVPTKTSYKNLSKDPPPGLGAYQFEKGSIQPNRQYVLVKNPNFSIPGIPKGNVDKITVKLIKSQARQAEDVISGKLDWMLDEPSTDLLPEIRAKYTGDRYEENTANSTYYMFMNTKAAPFDKLKVRQAVNYGFDKRAAVRLFGGLLTPDCNFLPPGMVGYTKIDPLPMGRPERRSRPREGSLPDQGGRRRGREGHGVGRRRGALQEDDGVLPDILNKIGLKATPKIIGAAALLRRRSVTASSTPRRASTTGSRTSRTRRTSSSYRRVVRSSRRTTRTTASSTIPRSTSWRRTSSRRRLRTVPTSRRSSTSTSPAPTARTSRPTGTRRTPRSSPSGWTSRTARCITPCIATIGHSSASSRNAGDRTVPAMRRDGPSLTPHGRCR